MDLHCHLLPGIDDGPAALEDAVAYARDAVAAGTGRIIATPHAHLVDIAMLERHAAAFRGALYAADVPLAIGVGAEVRHTSVAEIGIDALDCVAQGPAGDRWILYEPSFTGIDEAFLVTGEAVLDAGYGLLLAHPERTAGLENTGIRGVERLRRRGARVAINVAPLVGGEGPRRQEAAELLIARGFVDVIASDAHPPSRAHVIADAIPALRRLGLDADTIAALVAGNARKFLVSGFDAANTARRASPKIKYAGVIPTDSSGAVALQVRDDKPGIEHAGCVTTFGGAAEQEELPVHAAIRELTEELGLHASADDLRLVARLDSRTRGGQAVECHFFTVCVADVTVLPVFEGAGKLAAAPQSLLADGRLTVACRDALLCLIDARSR